MMVQQRRFTRSSAAAALALPAFVGASGILLAALPATPAQAQATGADLRVLSPKAGDTMGTGTFSLDVSFQSKSKSPITTAELWVDGVRWVRRDLDAPQTKNVLSFAVDASTLSEGVHAVVVKVFCANGAASSTQVNIQAGTNAGVSSGSISGPQMKLITPGNGKRVAGTVDVTIDAQGKNGVNPYVTFYVDKQFKTLKNYPPYTYAWDTTTVANGTHTIEAMGYLESANASTTRKVTVYVDNAGGATDIKSDIPDLNEARKQAPTTNAAHAAAAPVVLPLPKHVALAKKPTHFAPVSAATFAAPTSKTETVSALGLSPVGTTYRNSAADMRTATPAPARVAKKAASRLDVRSAGLAPLSPSLQGLTASQAGLVSAAPAFPTFRTPNTVHAAPRFASYSPPSRFAPLVPTTSAHRKTTRTAPRVVVNPAALAENLTRLSPRVAGKTFQVAFDGQQIAFDVQPRVEAGLPLAPFRQIFEHTGGQVMWVPETRVVRAVNADREIVIGVGQKNAHVNGQVISMQKPAFIERGRTIVPLSFVGKALDVDVKYDAATGHLQITSK